MIPSPILSAWRRIVPAVIGLEVCHRIKDIAYGIVTRGFCANNTKMKQIGQVYVRLSLPRPARFHTRKHTHKIIKCIATYKDYVYCLAHLAPLTYPSRQGKKCKSISCLPTRRSSVPVLIILSRPSATVFVSVKKWFCSASNSQFDHQNRQAITENMPPSPQSSNSGQETITPRVSPIPCKGCRESNAQCDRTIPNCSYCQHEQLLCFYVESKHNIRYSHR